MFKSLFGKKDDNAPRKVSSIRDLQTGDMLTLKPRASVPEALRGETLEVTGVAAYQYQSGISPELTLSAPSGAEITVSYSDSEEQQLCFSLKIPRPVVLSLFGEQEFSALWAEEFAVLTASQDIPEDLTGWITAEYRQTSKEGVAFYFSRDMREQVVSDRVDDDSEELRYHECSGGENEEYGLNVEFWESGETDVYLCKYLGEGVIEELWPGGR